MVIAPRCGRPVAIADDGIRNARPGEAGHGRRVSVEHLAVLGDGDGREVEVGFVARRAVGREGVWRRG